MISFSIVVFLVLCVGTIHVAYVEECKNVKMKMSRTKDGRIQLDVNEFCSCAGYTKLLPTKAPDFTRWKQPPSTNSVTDKSTVTDKISTKEKANDTTVDITTEKSSVAEVVGISTYRVIDKNPMDVTTESITATETKKSILDKVTDRGFIDKIVTEESSIVSRTEINIDIERIAKTTADKVTDRRFISKVTPKSSIGSTTERDIYRVPDKITADKVTDKSSKSKITEKSSVGLTTERDIYTVIDKNTADKETDRSSVNRVTEKRSMGATTEIPFYPVTDKSTVGKVVDKSSTVTTAEIALETDTKKSTVGKTISRSFVDKVHHKGSTDSAIERTMYLITDKIIDKSSRYNITDKKSIGTTSESATAMNTEKSPVSKITNDSSVRKFTNKGTTDTTTETVRYVIADKKINKVTDKSFFGTTTESGALTFKGKSTKDKITDTRSADRVTNKSSADAPTETAKYIGIENAVNKSSAYAVESFTDTMTKSATATTTKSAADKVIDKSSTYKVTHKISIDSTVRNYINAAIEKSTVGTVIDIRSAETIRGTVTADIMTTSPINNKTKEDDIDNAMNKGVTEKAPITYVSKIKSSDSAHQTSHMNEKDSKRYVLFIFLAIVVLAVFVSAISYLIYMRYHSNSYVLPSHNDVTPLNNIS